MINNRRNYIQKMAIAAMMIAFSIVVTRFIPGVQLGIYRLSLGAIPIVISSLILGPIWGGIVGVAADLIGTTLFPVGAFIIWPLLGSMLFGVLPSLVFLLLKKVRGHIKNRYILWGIMALIVIFISVVVIVRDSLTYRATYETTATIVFNIWWKIFTPIILIIVAVIIAIGVHFMEVRAQKTPNKQPLCPTPYEVAIIIFLTDLTIDVLYGPIWKMIVFSSNLLVNLFVQSLLFVVAVIVKTFIVYYLINIYYRVIYIENTK